MQVGGAWPPELLTDFGQPENWEQAEAYLLVLLAGPNAGAMARSDLGANVQAAKRPVESDLEQARAVIKAMATARPGTDIEAYLTELEDRSCEMLGSWWPAVEAVAEALLKRGTLWPKDVARLAQEAGPSGG